MQKKSILVTGASGFIGRNLAEALATDFDVSAPGRTELDLLDSESCGKFIRNGQFDAVIHCAGVGVSRASGGDGVFEANVRMFENVARCRSHFGKMLHMGSGAEYGRGKPLSRVREEEFGAAIPSDEYGRSKYECSLRIGKAENIMCLRIFGCYGKYEDYSTRFISNAVCRSIVGLPIVVEGQNRAFSYLYVGDLARIARHFITHGAAHKFYNAVPDEAADLLSIADKVKAICGNRLPITVRKHGMGSEYSGSNLRLRAELPSFAFTTLEQGIAWLFEWHSTNREKIDMEKLAPGAAKNL